MRFAVGAAALPFLPARMMWMRVMAGAARASQQAQANAEDALTLEAEFQAFFEEQMRELVSEELVPAGI